MRIARLGSARGDIRTVVLLNGMSHHGRLITLGQIPYASALTMQESLASHRLLDILPDSLLLLEHNPVFTAGRTAKITDCPVDKESATGAPIQVVRVNRGGSVTYHGPGQVVGYPILRLRDHCAGPKTYVSLLENVLIRSLADWGIAGRRRDRLPGVWIGSDCPMKIASIGIRIAQGITTHGFALNVDMDLQPFLRIVPCGISGCQVTSMAAVLGKPVGIARVMIALAAHFSEVFGLAWTAEYNLRNHPFVHFQDRSDHWLGETGITGGTETGRW